MAHQLTVDGEHGVVYVGAEDTSDVRALNMETGEEVCRTPLIGLTVDGMEPYPQENLLFIPSHFTESCLVVDTEKRKVVGDLHCGGWVISVALNRKTGMAFVQNAEDGEVAVFDASTLKPVAKVNLNVGLNLVHRMWNGMAVDERRNTVYVYLARRNALAVIDGDRLRPAGRVYLGPPHLPEPDRFPGSMGFQVAVNSGTGRVYVIDPFNLGLFVVDGKTPELLGRVDLSHLELPVTRQGDDPRSRRYSHFYNLNVNARRNLIYAWNVIIDENALEVVGQLPVDSCTGVTAVDENAGHLYCHGLRGLTILDAENYDELGNMPLEIGVEAKSELPTMWMVEPEQRRIYRVRNIMNRSNRLDVYSLR
jgi:hypothetical protein